MNKKFFTALIATILMAVSAIAQNNNTYSMVLTLNNGTVITIGPNELQKLDFKEGEVTATGTSITQLVDNITAMQAQIAMLNNEIEANKAEIIAAVASNKADIKNVQNQVEASNASIAALNAQVKKNQNDIAAVSEQVQASNESIAALNAQVKDNQNAIKAVSEQVQASNDNIAALNAQVKEDQDAINNMYLYMIELEKRIKALEQ